MNRKELNRKYKKEHAERIKEYMHTYRKINAEKIYLQGKNYRVKNKDKIKIYMKDYRIKNKDKIKKHVSKYMKLYSKLPYVKEKTRLFSKKRYWNNREAMLAELKKKRWNEIELTRKKGRESYRRNKAKVLERQRLKRKSNREIQRIQNARRRNNPLVKVSGAISLRIYRSLINCDSKKQGSWTEIVDFNLNELKQHLEKQFTKDMSWNNYGSYWEIDHKVPLSWFKNKEQLIKNGWRLSNLQPLPISLNRSKSNSYFFDVNNLSEEIIYA